MVDDPNKPYENDSFMDEDDFLAADRGDDEGDNQSGAPGGKPNFKEIWAQNPSLKIFAGVAFAIVVLVAVLAFGSSDEGPGTEDSSIRSGAAVTQAPGTTELPPAYEEAVRQESERRATEAAESGGSSLPTPIARPSERIEAPVQVEESDPLSEWRKEAEARRLERQQGGQPIEPVPDEPLPAPIADTGPAAPQNSGTETVNAAPAAEPPPPLPTAPSPDMIQAMTGQLQAQMQTLLETQVPKESVVVSMNIQPGYDIKKYFGDPAAQNAAAANAGNAVAANQLAAAQPKPLISAGTIAYAQVLTESNSDVPGPVLAEVASGPLLGGRALGNFAVAQRHLVLQFSRIVKDGVEYPVTAIALDPGTTLPAVVTDVDNHYFSRVFLPSAARFIEGFADAATQQDTSVVVSNGTVVSNTTQQLNTREELLQGVNEGAQTFAEIVQEGADRPITVKVAAGTRIGMLFTSAVFDPNKMTAQQLQNQYQQNQYQNQYQNQNGGFTQGSQTLVNTTAAGQAYNAYNNANNAGQQPGNVNNSQLFGRR
ncbi:MAG: DotG [Alphaproteobacteria bacterium]|nr:DotG [Alphaproteobacteria bacterium]